MSNSPAKPRDFYKYWQPEHVRYADLEVQRHVNNFIIGAYFQSARIGLLSKLGIMWGAPDKAIVVVRTCYDFYYEITWPNKLEVGLSVTKIGNTSFSMEAGIFVGDQCYTTQECVAIYWDPINKQKRQLDADVKASLEQYLSV